MNAPDQERWKVMGSTGDGPPQDEPDENDDPGPNQGVEDENENVKDDRRRAPANGDQKEPDDDDEGPLSDPDA